MFTEELDELRTWPTDRLLAARDEAVVEERRWRLRRVTLDRALEERGTTGPDVAEWLQTRDTVRTATARAEVEIARELEKLPAIAAAAQRGELSFDQLEHLVVLATPETDTEWAARGAQAAPGDLARMARRTRVVSQVEAEARQRAREFTWWRADGGMLRVRGAIPDVNGALVEAVFELCRAYEGGARPSRRWRPTIVIHEGSDAQPDVNGIPIATRPCASSSPRARRCGSWRPTTRSHRQPATASPLPCATTSRPAT